MARLLSLEWMAAFNEAATVPVPAAGPAGDPGIRGGSYAWCQVVTGVPDGPDEGVTVTLRVADGRLTMEPGAAPDAAATIRLAWEDARSMAAGGLAPAGAIAAGRVRVRGDLSVLAAGQAVLAALAPALAGLQATTTDD